MSPVLIAVCLSLTSDTGEEKAFYFLQKSNAPPATPGIPKLQAFKTVSTSSRSEP